MTSEMKQQQLEWRRAKVLELSSQGYIQAEIAQKLQLDRVTVHRDMQFLRQQAQETLQHHLDEVVPEEYQRCMTGMKLNLKQALTIGKEATDPKVKLEATKIANDCYKFIMEMSTNAGIVSDALKFVIQSEKKINNMQKQTAEETEEATTTETEGVY